MTDLRDQEKTFLREELQKVNSELSVAKHLLVDVLSNLTPKSEATEDVKEWRNKIDEAWAFIGVKRGEG